VLGTPNPESSVTMSRTLGIGSLFLTGVVAVVTLRIAHRQKEIAKQQAETARNKLRLELFDRRLPIYEAAMILADRIVRKGDISFEETQEFGMVTKSVRFLFNQELHADDEADGGNVHHSPSSSQKSDAVFCAKFCGLGYSTSTFRQT
jgi:hypothetical protein